MENRAAKPRRSLLNLATGSEISRGYALLFPTLAFMLVLIALPFAILLLMSFWTAQGFEFDTTLSLKNYQKIVKEPIVGVLMLRSLSISATVTLVTVLLCYPIAYYVAFHVHRRKALWILLLTLPFLTSYLLRVFAWKIILGYEGLINSTLMGFGLIDAPIEALLYSKTAVIVTLAHAWAAFAILPIYVSLEKIDRSLLETATDLGDNSLRRFVRIVLPLSLPGVISAALLIFIPTTGDYITPTLLGGPDGMMIGNYIQKLFGPINNWPMGAAVSVVLMVSITLASIAFVGVTMFVRKRIT
ncbi:ABC transporter permease [Albidovulum sp.]|uniref:ABC transporter permease n=1 Tax=Albidovulum sp. TaxID=1872424 RepID=UPI0039B9ACCB